MSKIFAVNLRTYRLLAGMTQNDLANATGITRSAVNNYECAKSEPSFAVLCRFAAALGVDLEVLVTEQHVTPDTVRRVQVTDAEWALLDVYRKADPTYQTVAYDILKAHRRED